MRHAVNVSRSSSARSDLSGIADYYGPLNPIATLEMLDRVAGVERMLSDHPLVGRTGRVAGTREVVVTGTPFLLVYVVSGNNVTILRVLDARQQWPDQ